MIRIGLTRGELKMMLEDGTPQVWRVVKMVQMNAK